MRPLFAVCAVFLSLSHPTLARELRPDAINNAQWSANGKQPKKLSPIVVKAQVLLDRAGFSPGVIDGRGGDNFTKALSAFQASHGMESSGRLDEATWAKLTEASADPVVVDYTITAADVKGPFVKKIPREFEQMAELEHLGYRGAAEALAEKFHMDQELLAKLNKRKSFDEPGARIIVANVPDARRRKKAARVEVNKSELSVRAFAEDGALVAFFPASIGSKKKPAPSGKFEVRAIAINPTYTYNPDYAFKGVKAEEKFTIAPGPNNPVGLVWIDLTAKSYGIHGTPEPDKVSKTLSHGCIRLTNWDALALAHMVKKGTPVEFRD